MQAIGILDSGVGGLSVWREVVRLLPHESIIYIADSANVPYGEKSPEEIYHLAKCMIDFLLLKEVKIIVIACNTITVSCLDRLRQDYPGTPLIGTVPVIKTAGQITKRKVIGVLATTRTTDSQYQKDLIKKFAQDCQLVSVGSDKLVPFIEQGITQGEELEGVLQTVLQPFLRLQPDAIALACTHFPFISEAIKKIVGRDVALLEPSGAIARHTKRILENNNLLVENGEASYTFYTSGDGETFKKVAKKLLGDVFRTSFKIDKPI